jgi:hypothetical protein
VARAVVGLAGNRARGRATAQAIGPGGAIERVPHDAPGGGRLPICVCPVLGAAGFDGLSLRLPSPSNEVVPAVLAVRDEPRSFEAPAVNQSDLAPRPDRRPETPLIAEQTTFTAAEAAPVAAPGGLTFSVDTTAIAAIGVLAWILGSSFAVLRLSVGWARMRRLRASTAPAEPPRRIEGAAEEVCDDYVVHAGAERARYAGHLLELAGRALPPMAPASVRMISFRSMLARRVVRILDTSRSLSTQAGWLAVMVIIAAGLAGTVFVGLLGASGRSQADASVQAADLDVQAEPEDKAIHGQVVMPDGKPMAGATVILARWEQISGGIGDGYASKKKSEIFRETTGEDGRFRFARQTDGQVIATAPGFGLGYLSKGGQIRLTAGDIPIGGRLVDLEGRPVAGVRVTLEQLWLPPAEPSGEPGRSGKSGSPVLKTRAAAGSVFSLAGRMGLQPEGLLTQGVVTDADGRFRVEGLGRDVLAEFTVTGPRIAYKRMRILTRNIDRIADSTQASAAGLADPAVYGASCTIAVEPTRPIEGFVRDAATGQPIAGATLTAASLSGSTFTVEGWVSTETDVRGHYRLVGLPKESSQGHRLSVYPPLDRPYFITPRLEAPAIAGYEPVKFDIALKVGMWITGKVTDIATGKGVPASVNYFPMLTNAHARDYPNFDPSVMSIAIKTRYRTDEAGRFRVVGLPVEGVVTVHTDDKTYRGGLGAEAIKGRTGQDQLLTYDRIFTKLYQGLKPISVPEGSSTFACDLVVDRGGWLRLRLVDESGKPVAHAAVWGRNPEGSDFGDHNLYGESVARIGGLEPGKPRMVLIKSHETKIGAVVTIPRDAAGKDEEMTVTLHPCATIKGRLVDGEGKPVSGGVRVELLSTSATAFRRQQVAMAEADAHGAFSCDQLPAAAGYQVSAANRLVHSAGRRMEPEAFKPFLLAKDLKLEAGQILDFGTIDVTTGKRKGDAPGAKPASVDIPVDGRIVNLEGRPVAGVNVKVNHVLIPKADNLKSWLDGVKKGEPPWVTSEHVDWNREAPPGHTAETTTDQAGRFRLEGFGADRIIGIELNGATIAHTSFEVVTRRIKPIPASGYANTFGPGKQTVYGAELTYTATPSRLVEGVVKDSKTGQALVGAEVRSYRFAGSDFIGIMSLKTRTDEQGRFRLAGLPKGPGNKIILVPTDEQPYFMQELEIPDPPGAGPVSVELALQKGIWILGKISEKGTGKPVEGAWLHYFPFLNNTFAQQHAAFGRDRNTDGAGFQDRYLTKADGTFRLVGLPGRAIVGAIVYKGDYMRGAGSEAIEGVNAAGHFETYNNPILPGRLFPTVMKEINPSASTVGLRVELEVVIGPSVRVSVVDPEGKPIADLKTRGRSGRSSYDKVDMTTADAEVANLMPDEARIVVIRHEGRKLGKVATVKKGDDASGPVVVKLAPVAAIRGRVVDAEGYPVAGARIRPDVLPHGDFGTSFSEVVTETDGRFLIPDIPTGCDYGIAVESSDAVSGRRFAYHSRAAVKPGETTDIGQIAFK